MEEIQYGKKYALADLRNIFNIGTSKNGTETIRYLSKMYKINKVARGFYVIERELNDIEKIEMQVYNKNRDYVEPMLYTMLADRKSNSITMDMHQLMKEVEIVNNDFHYIKYHTKECSLLMNQPIDYGLDVFIKEAEPMLKRIIRDVLKDMEDKQLIKVTKIPVLAYRSYDLDLQRTVVKTRGLTKDKDIQKLLEIKREILNDVFHVERESDISYFDQTQFKDLIAKAYDASYFYYKYNIILNKKGLQEYTNNDINLLKASFNKYIQNKIRSSKQGNLKALNKEEKDIYIKYCIDSSKDYKLRDRNYIQID